MSSQLAATSSKLAGDPSLAVSWNPTNTADTSTITISFSQAVVNPIIHLDRLGELSGLLTNSALLTLLTPGATLDKVSGPLHFLVDSSARTITRPTGLVLSGTESSLRNTAGTAAGSVRVGGTFTSLSFSGGDRQGRRRA